MFERALAAASSAAIALIAATIDATVALGSGPGSAGTACVGAGSVAFNPCWQPQAQSGSTGKQGRHGEEQWPCVASAGVAGGPATEGQPSAAATGGGPPVP